MAFEQAPGQYPYPGGQPPFQQQGFQQPGFPQPGYAPYGAPSGGSGRMIGFGITLLLFVLLELVLLISDAIDAGPGMLGTVFGIGSDYAYGPIGFYPTDLGIVIVLVVCAIGAFGGRSWSRAGSLPLLAVFAYGNATQLLNMATRSDMPGLFRSTWYTYLTLLCLAEIGLTVVIILVGALSGRGARGSTPAPVPQQQAYYGGPQQQAQPQPQPQVQPQQPQPQPPYGYGYPPPPGQPPVA